MQPVIVQGLEVGGIRTQTVFGEDKREVGVVLAQRGNEAFGRMAFTIIFGRAILCDNGFGHQRNHCALVRMDQRRAQHLVIIGDRTVAVDFLQTRRTVNRRGGKIPRAVKG